MSRPRARLVAMAATLASLGCVVALHGLRTDLPPVSHRLSEYANGPHGWLMTVAFTTLGGAMAATGVALRTGGTARRALVVRVAPFVAAVGLVLSALFPTRETGTVEAVHSRASALATVATVALAVAWSWSAPDRVAARGVALVAVVLTAVSPLLHRSEWTGLGQRLLWASLLAWLLLALAISPGARPSRGGGGSRPRRARAPSAPPPW